MGKKIIYFMFLGLFFIVGFKFMSYQEKIQMGEKYLSEKKYSQAEGVFNSVLVEIIKLEPENEEEKIALNIIIPQIYFKLGEAQFNQGNYDSAQINFESTLSYPNESAWNPKALYYLGKINFGAKKYSIARGNFSTIVDSYTSSKEAPEAQYYIGVSYEMEDNKEQAIISFKKFLTLYPKHEWVGEINKKIGEIQR